MTGVFILVIPHRPGLLGISMKRHMKRGAHSADPKEPLYNMFFDISLKITYHQSGLGRLFCLWTISNISTPIVRQIINA
jgi:hypothetical protein